MFKINSSWNDLLERTKAQRHYSSEPPPSPPVGFLDIKQYIAELYFALSNSYCFDFGLKVFFQTYYVSYSFRHCLCLEPVTRFA